MAKAADTMQFLMKAYEIAPAGTREEAVAAKELSKVFHEHGLESAVTTFNYKSLAPTLRIACALLVALCGIIAGCSQGVLAVIMFILALIAAALYVLELRGIKTVSLLGPDATSQNIIARHPAAVSANNQKKRPVVIVAHYDTPRSNIFAAPFFKFIRAFGQGIVHICLIIIVCCCFIMMLPVPGVFHSIIWALAILSAVVVLVWGVGLILHQYVLPFTYGANNNKASVAALFGVLDRVRPADGPIGSSIDVLAVNNEDASGDQYPNTVLEPTIKIDRPSMAASAPLNKRRGEEAVRSLGILPASCELVYIKDEPKPQSVAASSVGLTGFTVPVAQSLPEEELDPETQKERTTDAIMAGIIGQNQPDLGSTSLMSPVSAGATTAFAAQTGTIPSMSQPLSVITVDDAPDTELRHLTGELPLDLISQNAGAVEQFVADEPLSPAAQLASSSDWGTTSFTPVQVNRRLLGDDIPDPAVAAVDPFSVSSVEVTGDFNPEDFSEIDFETGTHETVTPAMLEEVQRRNLDGFTPEFTDKPKRHSRKDKKKRSARISQQAEQMKAEMEEQSFTDWMGLDEDFDAKTSGREIGSWSNFEDDATNGSAQRWQGGAARARRPRKQHVFSDSGDSEARQAAMSLGDRDLVEHEVWFVLTGAGEAGHVGAQDFYERFRDDIRGAYIINLECVGAGRQSLIIEEGIGNHIKADRRLVNLFGSASVNINRPLALERLNGRETDGTDALRKNCRAVSVCGIENGSLAYAGSAEDTLQVIDANQIDDLVDIIVEVIKNA